MTTYQDVPSILTQSADSPVVGLQSGTEPIIHGIVGAYYGDLEVDVGKSVRWLEYVTDDLFITDVNTGEQRYWVVNWAKSFPYSKHVVTGRNFFLDQANWRREQFEYADKAWNYGANDWCLFIDGSEGLSFDTRTLPSDYNAFPFMSWVYREVSRAIAAGQQIVVVPTFVYLSMSDLQNITYGPSTGSIPATQQSVAVPWYLPYQGLPRLFKVSKLREVGFNWASLDVFATPSPSVKMQIVSYAYAHWAPLDVPPGQTTVPPLSSTNDPGFQMRQLISKLRPVTGLPFATWQDPSVDVDGVPGPWCVDTVVSVIPDIADIVEEDGHTLPDVTAAGVRVPLYDTVFRFNLRDGLWYDSGESGNMPVSWDETTQTWVPRYDSDEWEQFGVHAAPAEPPPPSDMSLRLNGSAGTYIGTSDSANLDFVNACTLLAMVQFADWTPATEKVIASKWGAAGQRSWYWSIGGVAGERMTFVISRDGTASVAFVADVDLPADGTAVGLGLSYFISSEEPARDVVYFWKEQPDGTWIQLGGAVYQPNPTKAPLFNSTAEVQIGAYLGIQANADSLYRLVSFRRLTSDTLGPTGRVAGDPADIGGTEVALMRGDLSSNPTQDRYGNTWTNYGGWSYVPMPNMPPMTPEFPS